MTARTPDLYELGRYFRRGHFELVGVGDTLTPPVCPQPEGELLSECCEAEAVGELDPDMNTGVCSHCNDSAVFLTDQS